MAFFEWKEEYSVDVPSVDKQHQKLVEMLNDLHESRRNGTATPTGTKKTIESLIAYVITHFNYEEQLMREHGYPEYEEHKRKHILMAKRVDEFASALEQGTTQSSAELAAFLKDWLQKHIQGTDKRYGPFLKDKGVV